MSDKPLPFEKLKNSKLLGSEFFDEDLDTVARKEIDELVTLLEMARVSTLVICVCNPPVLRKKILDILKEKLSDFNVGIYDVSITEEDEQVVKLLLGIEQSKEFRWYEKKYRSAVLSVMGTENIFKAKNELKISRFYQNLNLYRDYFIRSKHPTLLWVNEAIASDMTIKAPDFWRARTKVAIFRLREEMVVEGIMQISELPRFYRDLADIKRREKIHERLLQSLDPTRSSDKIPYAVLSFDLGMLKANQGLYDKAEELYQQSLDISRELENKYGIAITMGALGVFLRKIGRFEDAFKSSLRAAYLCHELGLPQEKRALRDMAITAKKLGKEKFNKILEETPEEMKTYLKNLYKRPENK